MLTERILEELLAQEGLSAPVRFDEVTRSTNETALALAEEGAPEWTLVAAGHQTGGRGRFGRTWVDEPGAALMFSIVLRPSLPPARVGVLSLLAGSAVVAAAREQGVGAACKWPNDLLVDDGKAGGILAEARVEGDRVAHLVLGVGMNLGSAPSEVAGAAALGDVDPAQLLGSFLRSFRGGYQPADPAFAPAVAARYREVCATLGRPVRVVTVDGPTVEGTAVDVDEAGGLVLETAGGRETVTFGEVEHLR